MREIRIKSPAKINLGLKVYRKREDGFHEVETILQMVNLYDIVTLQRIKGGIVVLCNNSSVPEDENNLAYRAAELIKGDIKIDRGVLIKIDKYIPVSAGLGGGSSNAAVTLIGLNRLWDLGLKRDKLIDLAKLLGSDVPFFIFGTRAIARGRGEELEYLSPGKKIPVVLVNPNLPLSTSWVYHNLDLKLTNKENSINLSMLIPLLDMGEIKGIGRYILNDLESPALKRLPVIKDIKDKLQLVGAACSIMSGSGPTVFGLFSDYNIAKEACPLMKKEGWSVFLTETIVDLQEIYPREVL
ncbi:MAG: 4-(cytidine 5'-diphospho)-2-C-methyl-D-erythritol kinase [Nitrospinae bacterium]|nr:4-(cytidine 5'-diphospho)-2-C-methyl-D-erythritol kinase [Nitrospinota bacterium]